MTDWLMDSGTGARGGFWDWAMTVWLYPIPLLLLVGLILAAREKARHPNSDAFGLATIVIVGSLVWWMVAASGVLAMFWSVLVAAFTPAVQPAQKRETTPDEEDMPRVDPLTDDDGFCSCPSCGLVGTHAVRREVFRTPKYDDGHGDVVEVFCAAMPVAGSPVTKRTCVFCGHTWLRTAQEAA